MGISPVVSRKHYFLGVRLLWLALFPWFIYLFSLMWLWLVYKMATNLICSVVLLNVFISFLSFQMETIASFMDRIVSSANKNAFLSFLFISPLSLSLVLLLQARLQVLYSTGIERIDIFVPYFSGSFQIIFSFF